MRTVFVNVKNNEEGYLSRIDGEDDEVSRGLVDMQPAKVGSAGAFAQKLTVLTYLSDIKA